MNFIQSLIDRQLGICNEINYDHVLRRLVVQEDECFYGLQDNLVPVSYDQDPPIFACRFAEAPGYEHILALANEDGRVALQDTSKVGAASKLDGFQCHNNAVFDLAWMPQHTNFVTVSGDHTACLWDAGGAGGVRRVLTCVAHTRSVKTVAFRPTSPQVFASGARDGCILLWDTRAGPAPRSAKRARVEGARAGSVTALAFIDDVTLMSSGECDGNIKAWDLRRTHAARRAALPALVLAAGGARARGVSALAARGGRLYACCLDGALYRYRPPATAPERLYAGHEPASFYVKASISPDGRYLACGSSDKFAYIWNVNSPHPVARLGGHAAEVTCVAWRRPGPLALVTCGDDARHKLWRVGPEHPPAPARLRGRALPAPPGPDLPVWLDRTPARDRSAAERPASEPTAPRRGKRCLAALLGASHEDRRSNTKCLHDDGPSTPKKLCQESIEKRAGTKRPHDDGPSTPKKLCQESSEKRAGTKRPHENDQTTPTKKSCSDTGWSYIPQPGVSFLTPSKSFSASPRRVLSPRTQTNAERTPEKSPSNERMITFGTPTRDLPNFVLDGSAPHLRLMSPRKRKVSADWLTQLRRERSRGHGDKRGTEDHKPPSSPKENIPVRRNSTHERTPKSAKKTRTLLKYFSVAGKK